VTLGVEILTKSKWLLRARDVVEYHHERYDGSGYPKGLAGAEIPLAGTDLCRGRCVRRPVSKRPYKDALAFDVAMVGIREGAGSLFDPDLVTSFEGIAGALYHETRDVPGTEVEARLQQQISRYFGLTA
jgi:response regulator RpfG family c-di-GMP phosphodiesterase